jgi:Flp pilus assembly protein TadG
MQDHLPKHAIAAIWQAVSRFLGDSAEARSGVAAVEFAIIAPAVILMAIVTADVGLGIYCKMRVQNSAQFGTQYAVVHGYDATAITNAVMSATSFPGLSITPAPYQFCGCPTTSGIVTYDDCSSFCPDGSSPGVYASVSTQGTYSTIVPYPLFPNSYTFTTQATVRIQ